MTVTVEGIMSSEELLKKAQQALSASPRERFKILKQIGFEALEKFNSSKDPSVDDLKNYREIFTIVKTVPAISNKFQIALTKIINKYLLLLGCDNPKILLKKSTTIVLDSATIAIGDKSYSTDTSEALDEIELINAGKIYSFGTGSDGTFNVQLRVVEAPEPVLTSKEYKNVVGASPTIFLTFPSGKVAVDDYGISSSNNQIEETIIPGNYKCQVFVFKFPKGDYSFYIVLSKCEHFTLNNENEILRLEPNF